MSEREVRMNFMSVQYGARLNRERLVGGVHSISCEQFAGYLKLLPLSITTATHIVSLLFHHQFYISFYVVVISMPNY